MDFDSLKDLYSKAYEASKKAYAPYSNFHVGAAILVDSGEIITGCNIENRSFGATNCAERTATFKAVSEGHKHFSAVAIATPDSDYPVGPCGICRQVLSEFAGPETPVIFGSDIEKLTQTTLAELYPFDSLHELAK